MIVIDDNILKPLKISKKELKLDLAIGLFIDYKTTLGQSAQIANMTQGQFSKELSKRQISLHYDIEDFNEDMKTIESLNL